MTSSAFTATSLKIRRLSQYMASHGNSNMASPQTVLKFSGINWALDLAAVVPSASSLDANDARTNIQFGDKMVHIASRWMRDGKKPPVMPPVCEDVLPFSWFHLCQSRSGFPLWLQCEDSLHLGFEPRHGGSKQQAQCPFGCWTEAQGADTRFNAIRVAVQTLDGVNLLGGRFEDWFVCCCECGSLQLNLLRANPSFVTLVHYGKNVARDGYPHCADPEDNHCEYCFPLTRYRKPNRRRRRDESIVGGAWDVDQTARTRFRMRLMHKAEVARAQSEGVAFNAAFM
ncbi:hypothetical protein B0T24DRAFT_714720 [Lasiosphaeria ovina]|uniref:Uncharacterized protein n=1 Tax=Lasiosphaeria ovina TaxID=92902 RepID=A0AAE0NJG2_9PEZI|nr:hypothetical protein B0T24DRAFT_714720 [Lasiosphaeria ovina]